jgi:stearoyl-CoA desaturase (delta-9 desaturase)
MDAHTNPEEGNVSWSPAKTMWFGGHLLIAIIGGSLTWSWSHGLIGAAFTGFTLCLGHSVGLHRLLIHRSFECPRWVEYTLVHLGIVVGMAGPRTILYMHDIRDWAQRHPRCHRYFIHRNSIRRDFFWQQFGRLDLKHPPRFVIEPRVEQDSVYRWMERTWMLQSLPWAVLFWFLGGWSLVIWATSVRIATSLLGHWLVGYLAHNTGRRDWDLQGHAVQGYNLPAIALLTMGESLHNNHHAFPESARLGLRPSQPDPGWWLLCLLRRLGLAWNLKEPRDLPDRPELIPLAPERP